MGLIAYNYLRGGEDSNIGISVIKNILFSSILLMVS